MNRVRDFSVGQDVVRVRDDDARYQGDCTVVELRDDWGRVGIEFLPEGGGDPVRLYVEPDDLRVRVGDTHL